MIGLVCVLVLVLLWRLAQIGAAIALTLIALAALILWSHEPAQPVDPIKAMAEKCEPKESYACKVEATGTVASDDNPAYERGQREKAEREQPYY